jgi:hypothetical protein
MEYIADRVITIPKGTSFLKVDELCITEVLRAVDII